MCYSTSKITVISEFCPKQTESKTDEEKKEDEKPEEKKESEEYKKETVADDKSEVVELHEKPEEKQVEQDLVLAIQHFIKYIKCDYSDAEYYLKEVKGKLALSMEDENLAMTQMLESFVAHSSKQQTVHQQNAVRPKEVQEQIRPSSPSIQSAPPKMGLKSAQQMQMLESFVSHSDSTESHIMIVLVLVKKWAVSKF